MTDPTPTPGAPVPPDELIRYGVLWRGPTEPTCEPMGDGYWTPWHIAQARIAQAMQEREELAIEAYQSGYARGHNDTVEGCYNLAAESEPEAAEEVIAELVEDRARAAAEAEGES
jgi:hypothetical protein